MLAVSLTACSSGRTNGPALARVDARPLAALADRISREAPCAQQRDIRLLQQRAVRLVNLRRVPRSLLDPLMSGVNALAADTPPCVPTVPAQATTTQPAAVPPPVARPHGHFKKEKHGHGKHGHGEHGD